MIFLDAQLFSLTLCSLLRTRSNVGEGDRNGNGLPGCTKSVHRVPIRTRCFCSASRTRCTGTPLHNVTQ
eukprot:4700052-Pyramimonas_sp.AAC.3